MAKTLTIPFAKSRETENTVRFYQELGKDEPTPATGLYMTKAVLEMLAADNTDHLVITIRAEKRAPGMTVDPKDEPKKATPATPAKGDVKNTADASKPKGEPVKA